MSDHHGVVIWNELNTRDVAAAKAYYGAVFGWSFETAPIPGGEGEYTTAKLGDTMVAGIFDITGMPGLENVPPHWMTYFGVDDIDASFAASTEAGGQVIRPPFEVEGVGKFAIVIDASGGAIGLMQPTMP